MTITMFKPLADRTNELLYWSYPLVIHYYTEVVEEKKTVTENQMTIITLEDSTLWDSYQFSPLPLTNPYPNLNPNQTLNSNSPL